MEQVYDNDTRDIIADDNDTIYTRDIIADPKYFKLLMIRFLFDTFGEKKLEIESV
jgi:hypothetical protein